MVAEGRVTTINVHNEELRAHCDVWLERNGERVVVGTAVVALSNNFAESL